MTTRTLSNKPILTQKISNLEDIIGFINDLTTNFVEINTDINRRLVSPIKKKFNDEIVGRFMDELSNSKIYRAVRKLFSLKLKLVGITGSEVRLRLVDCVSVVQELEDKAEERNLLSGRKKYEITALKGALRDFLYMISTLDNELVILSKDDAQLRKTAMAVFLNASKLMSLENSVFGKSAKKTFKDFLSKLGKEDQEMVVNDYLLEGFNPDWLPLFSSKVQQRCLDHLLENPEIDVQTPPPILLQLFLKFNRTERGKFIALLKTQLDGSELNALRGEKVE